MPEASQTHRYTNTQTWVSLLKLSSQNKLGLGNKDGTPMARSVCFGPGYRERREVLVKLFKAWK